MEDLKDILRTGITGKNQELFDKLMPQVVEQIEKCIYKLINTKNEKNTFEKKQKITSTIKNEINLQVAKPSKQTAELKANIDKNLNELKERKKNSKTIITNKESEIEIVKDTAEEVLQTIILESLKYDITSLREREIPKYFYAKEKLSDKQIMVKHADAKLLLEIKNIICLKSYVNDTDFFLVDKNKMADCDRIQTGINLGRWIKFLNENNYETFIQIHKSNIVNMKNQIGYKSSDLYLIKEIRYRCEEHIEKKNEPLKNTKTTYKLPVGETYKSEVLKYFENFPTPK